MSGILRKPGRYRMQNSFIFILKKKNRQEKEKPHNQLFDKAPNQSARLKVMNM